MSFLATQFRQPQAAAAEPLLEAADLVKVYRARGGLFSTGAENRALDGVSLTLRPGEIVGLVGESGCGKSTFAKVLLGLERADAGALTVASRPIFGPGMRPVPSARRGIQMVFQDPYGSLNPRMKVADLVGEGLRIRGGLSRRAIRDEVARHLELVGLTPDAMDKYAHQFSGGQRQRLAIARAVIMRPQVLIADEAASALDVSVQMQILNLLLDLRDELRLTILFISHDMGVIEYLCDRIAVMYAGRIVEENEAGALIDAPAHPYAAHLIAARPTLGAPKVDVAPPPEGAWEPAGAGCSYAGRCPNRLDRCSAGVPDLVRSGPHALACFNPLASRPGGTA